MENRTLKYGLGNTRGFTLVELLIAMAMLGAVMAAVLSLYNMQHKVTHIEEDVVEVQQNLRMALDYVTRDLRMAGLVVSGTDTPLDAFANDSGLDSSDTLTLNIGSADWTLAKVAADLSTSITTTTPITLTVTSAAEVTRFDVGDVVRVVSSAEQGQPLDTTFTITAKDTGTPSLSMLASAAGTGVLFKKGNLIVKTGTSVPDTYPNTVEYCLGPAAGCGSAITACPSGQNCLMRIVNGAASNDSIIASNITGLQLKYIADGTTAEVDSPATLSAVRAVRVTLEGQTEDTAGLSGGAKTREVTSIAKIRNR